MSGAPQLSALSAQQMLQENPRASLLDVREPWEFTRAGIADAYTLPLSQFIARWQELDRKRCWLVLCHHGVRSDSVASFLCEQGFEAHNIVGGIAAWADEVDSSVGRY